MRLILTSLFTVLLFSQAAYGSETLARATPINYVVVKKSLGKLYLMKDYAIVKEYKIALGGNPIGHKQSEGDQRTPEGLYTLDYKNENSRFYRSIHISYPNQRDRLNARKKGLEPGGDIMIHGQKNGMESMTQIMQKYNWTEGCIAVTNAEMDEIMSLVSVGTPIEIRP